MDTRIKAEWDRLRTVAIHRPGMEMFFGLLEPYASLYERAFSKNGAIREHERLEHILTHEFHVKVHRLQETIIEKADHDDEAYDSLVEKALEAISFTGDKKEAAHAEKELQFNKQSLDASHFFDILILNPQIELETESGTRMIHLNVTERQPLSNLYFMRDQQAVTDKGIFLSRMSKPQRRRETEITRLLWNTLDAPIAHAVEEPGTFEGGDFIPVKDFALVGVGDRTNEEGIKQLLANGIDFDEVGVVHQPNHPLLPSDKPDPMVDMHLDTYFNIASSGVAVGLEPLLKEAKVDVYQKISKGEYEKQKKQTDLFSYIKEWGFDVVNITTLEQLSYASNFLTIKDNQILAVEVERDVKDVLHNLKEKANDDPVRYGKLLLQAQKDYEYLKSESEFFPHKKRIYEFGIDAYPLVLKNLTGGYGAAHCMTAALERR